MVVEGSVGDRLARRGNVFSREQYGVNRVPAVYLPTGNISQLLLIHDNWWLIGVNGTGWL